MKELLVKDYRILLTQKKNLVFILAIGLLMGFTTFTMDFMVGYLMVLTMILSAGTVNYDDFDNGMAFIMTLPASRKAYAIEKYVLTFINILVCGAFIFVIYLVTRGFMNWELSIGNMVLTVLGWICGIMLSASALLPLYLKFSAEIRRVIMLIVAGIVALILYSVQSLINHLYTDRGGLSASESVIIGNIVGVFERMNAVVALLAIVGVVAVFITISIGISIKIMQKKEF